MSIALLCAAAALAVVYGSNAGGTIVSAGLTVRAFSPLVAVLVLGAGVAVAPLVAGTAVATTMADELVTLDGALGQAVLLAAVVAALVVTTALSWIGIPTSLTIGLIGGIAGSGLGAGLPVSWTRIVLVLAGVAIAPLIGGIVAHLLHRLIQRWPTAATAHRLVRRIHVLAYVAIVFAFGTNDAQKLLAVTAVAAGTVGSPVPAVGWQVAGIGALFALGAALGAQRMSTATNAGVLRVQPLDAAATELSTAIVMFAGSAFGNPAGMAQTLTGSLVGAGISKRGRGRVRWDYAGRIASAWAATMPAAFLAGLALGAMTGALPVG